MKINRSTERKEYKGEKYVQKERKKERKNLQ
jgi:hypothetical protein